ncbi:carbohydrate ABC transporter permease [Paenibacillus sp. NPDC058071]|uniref:carbohydrate ABC transporter permease n=1 Tax=Paenibacillus sp. NPDC058071 TaxID=3346326 RepID=UPI0036DD4161
MNGKPTWSSTLHALLYLLPAAIVIGLFCIYPVYYTFDESLNVNGEFIYGAEAERGIGNYKIVWSDPLFHAAMKNTLIVIAGVVPVSLLLALVIASGLRARIHLKRYVQSAYFLPLVTSVVAASLAWRWLYHTEYGLINTGLSRIGLPAVSWLTSSEWALPALILFIIWRSLGYNVLLLWIGLQSIPSEFERAARADGVTVWSRWTKVTLPLLAPTLLFCVVNAIVHAGKTFDEAYALFGGGSGPMDSAMTVMFYVYEKFYGQSNYGIASAAAYILFAVMFSMSLWQFWLFRKRMGRNFY